MTRDVARAKVDEAVLELWRALRDLSDYEIAQPGTLLGDDLELMMFVVQHHSIQDRLDAAAVGAKPR